VADEADLTSDRMEVEMSARLAELHRTAVSIPAGYPGECERCGEESPRLVDGVCARCRDLWHLP
jgi:hypothetical protein